MSMVAKYWAQSQPPQEVRRSGPMSTTKRVTLYVALSLLAVVMALPFLAMLLMAFRPDGATSLRDIFFSTTFTLDNVRDTLRNDSMLRWFLNSTIYAVVSVVLVLFLSSLGGYAFAKKRYVARDQLFWLFIAMYGTARIISEQFREPDEHLRRIVGGVLPHMTAGMLLSIPLLVFGVVMVLRGYQRWGQAHAKRQAEV